MAMLKLGDLAIVPGPGDDLTDRQREVLIFLVGGLLRDGFQPSIREFMDRFGMLSMNAVRCHFRALERKGYLDLAGLRSRGLRLRKLPASVVVALQRPGAAGRTPAEIGLDGHREPGEAG